MAEEMEPGSGEGWHPSPEGQRLLGLSDSEASDPSSLEALPGEESRRLAADYLDKLHEFGNRMGSMTDFDPEADEPVPVLSMSVLGDQELLREAGLKDVKDIDAGVSDAEGTDRRPPSPG